MLFFLLLIINLCCNKELNKLWQKRFKTVHQLSCFVGHPVHLSVYTERVYNYKLMIIKKLGGK